MHSKRIVILGLLALTGCKHLNGPPKVDNPVMPPPPPRVSGLEQSAAPDHRLADLSSEDEAGGVRRAALRGQSKQNVELLPPTTVVATVNGVPIFASDVLGPYELQLQAAYEEAVKPDGKLTLRQLREIQEGIIQRDLDVHVERTLLVNALKSTLTSEQIKMLESHLEAEFEKEARRMQEKLGVNTKHELDLKMQENGTTLDSLQQEFVRTHMAREFLGAKTETKRDVTRRDMAEHYQAHREEYAIPAQVRWQQIQVSHLKAGGKRPAREKIEQALAELRSGADFGAVAQKYSDGVTASAGGHWDWMGQGSLADTKLEQLLFRLRPGVISEIHEGPRAYELVQVIDRKPPSYKPFAELQDEIKQKLEEELHRDAPRKVLDDLLASAVIETMFDKAPARP